MAETFPRDTKMSQCCEARQKSRSHKGSEQQLSLGSSQTEVSKDTITEIIWTVDSYTQLREDLNHGRTDTSTLYTF
jgi:hypothetical protein